MSIRCELSIKGQVRQQGLPKYCLKEGIRTQLTARNRISPVVKPNGTPAGVIDVDPNRR